ncbi:YrdB family protein [Streptomyces sp. SS]|uniref:YrdB family protein n=1 Tax=Streptomyces sp. SS TaxID=260742 RepID=UPI0002FF9414|nr:YrdB family protein [Streptomyces sp. SS]
MIDVERLLMNLPGPLHVLNEGLAFLLELAALAVLAWWGWSSAEPVLLRLALALAAPALAAVVWGLFAAPKARIRLPLAGVLLVKALVFGAAALALHALDRPSWAVAFALVALLNTALATADRQAAMHRAA